MTSQRQDGAKFETLLEAVPDALVGVDKSGVIRFVNHKTEVLFGYDSEDLVGRPIEALVPASLPQIQARPGAGHVASLATREMGTGREVTALLRDGTEFPVDISLTSIDTDDGPLVIAALRDMTEQKRAIDHNHRLGRLAAIVEYSDDAIVGTTLDGIISSWNPAAERMYGYSIEEVIDKPVRLIYPPDRAEEMKEILSRIKNGEHVDHLDTYRRRKDGTLVPVSLTVSPIHDEDGDNNDMIVGASTIAHDVTELRQAYEAARSMLESSLDSMVAIGPQGTITDVNEATVKITGVPREALIGTDFSEYFTEPEEATRVYLQVFTEGTAVDHPLTIRHRNGMLSDVLYNGSVHRDTAGHVLGVFAAARNITKQKQAYEAARSMIESSLDSMVSISPEGKITDVNAATVKVTGVPREVLIGTDFSDYFTEPEKANRIYQMVLAGEEAVDFPLTMCDQDGTLTDVLYNAAVYRDTAGDVLGVFAAARDVTKQRQAARENAAQQVKALERLAELERFERLTVGRELRMIELKKEIEHLKAVRSAEPQTTGLTEPQTTGLGQRGEAHEEG